MNAVQKLSKSNPYSGVGTQFDEHGNSVGLYKVSPWQNMMSWLGIRTKADAWNENMAIQEREYNAALEQKAYDEQYNLPVNQVARMRAAGINPDLDGGKGIDSGQASPMGEDPSTPMQSTGDEDTIANFANGILSVFSSGLGIVQSMQGITRNRIQNMLLGTQAESQFADFAKGISLDFLPLKPDNVVDENGATWSWQHDALLRASIFAKKNLPKKMQQKFLDEVQAFWQGAPATEKAFQQWTSVQKSRFEYGMSRGTYGDLTTDDVLYGMTKPLADLALRALKANYSADAARAENDATYQEELDPALAAEAQNSTNSANKATNDINSMLRGTMVEILSFLKGAAKGSGVGAGLANIALALLSAQSLGMVPNVPIKF